MLLTGGSAFGLAAAAGVMRYLEEHEVGFEFAGVRVPVVAGAVIFDLFEGDPTARPDAVAGYEACGAATRSPEIGAVGAGTGATVAKAGDRSETRPGGVGIATTQVGDAHVAAVMVSNSVGGIWDDERHEWVAPLAVWTGGASLRPGTNTAIGVVATDARLTKEQANRAATVAHDGIARSIRPSHTMYDGDAIFCLATGARRRAVRRRRDRRRPGRRARGRDGVRAARRDEGWERPAVPVPPVGAAGVTT